MILLAMVAVGLLALSVILCPFTEVYIWLPVQIIGELFALATLVLFAMSKLS